MVLSRLITLIFASSLILGAVQGTSEPVMPDSQDPFGYLIVYPKVLFAGTNESICATIKDTDETVEVTLSFMENNVTVISSVPPFNVEFDTACVTVKVPTLDEYPKTINLKAEMKRLSMPKAELSADKKVVIVKRELTTFVQTDKPIYKPGQTVMFRVLTLDKDLKPDTQAVLDVWIETPFDIRVAQWLSQTSKDGLIDLQLPMSSDPPLGEWKIVVVRGSKKIEKTFKVDEYVLPKFEILVTYPPFVVVDAKEFEIRICGRYTYGQPVRGSFSADIDLEQQTNYRSWWYGTRPPRPTLRFESADTGESGCSTIVISGEALQLNNSNYPIWSSVLKVDTNFTEAATGVTLSSTDFSKKGIVTTDPLHIVFNAPSTFKPGMPFHAVLSVKYPDGLPAAGKDVKVTAKARADSETTILNGTFTSSDKGEINIVLDDVDFKTRYIDLFAEAKGYSNWVPYDSEDYREDYYYIYDPLASHYTEASYSPSGSFVQVAPIEGQLVPGTEQEIMTHFTADPDVVNDLKWFFVFMSRSEILTVPVLSVEEPRLRKKRTSEPFYLEYETEEVNITEPGQLFSRRDKFTITTKMSPISRLLVYYILPDKEVVADSIKFDVKPIFENQVSITFATAEEAPGAKAVLKLSATGGSLCALGVVDKSVYILEEDKDQISKDNIFNKMRNDDQSYNTYWVPHQSDHCPNEYPWWWYSGLDRRRRKRTVLPYGGGSSYEDASQAFKDMGLVFLSNLRVETRPCNTGRYPFAVAYDSVPQGGLARSESGEEPLLAESVRSFFPETWLWQLERISDSGESDLKVEVPHTITEWIGNGFCLSPETGLGVSDTTNLQAFQPFFVSLTLPYSIIRGEEVPIKATVFNYLRDECVVVRVSLIESDKFAITGNTFTYKECVCAQTAKTVEFPVKALALGEIDIEVHAVSVSDDEFLCGNEASLHGEMGQSDAVRRKLLVEPEGIQHEESANRYFCPNEFPIGSYIERFLQLAPPNIVEGSLRGKFSLTGDLMGQTLSNLDNLLRVPTGCGEQNMLGFVPNIVVMKYLTESGTLTDNIKMTAETNMKRGYMRELNYRHKDGSYSAFGESDESGSTWLTAYVVRSFAQAAEFIDIDQKDLDVSLEWLKERQNRRGCFNAIGHLCHKAMAGGVNNEITLTAYVVTTMLEAGVTPEDPVIQKALTCLESQSVSDTYAAAQLAYAMVLAGHPNTGDVMEYLESLAVVEGNTKHWVSNRNESNEYSSYYRASTLSQEIEMTAYVLLAYTEYLNHIEARLEGSAVSRWLVGQRSSNGGFSSTQDTVIGLQALAAYAGILNNQPLKMSVDLMENNRKIRQFELLEKNKLVMQEMELSLPSAYMVRARGSGCGLLQFTMIYNTLPLTPPVAPFTLTKRTANLDNECKSYLINLCASYTGPGSSNMLLTEVKLTTGFAPDKASLDKLREQSTKSKLKRVESDGKIINFYLDQGVDETPVCWEFIANKEFDVKDAKPGTLNLYDYYEKDLAISDSLEFSCEFEEPKPAVFVVEIPDIREEPEVEGDNLPVQRLDEKPEITTTRQPATTTQTQTPTTTAVIADPYCLLDPEVCGDNGVCVDDASQVLLYRCQCETGYEEIGGQCTDVDECVFPDSCPGPNMVCNNLPGTYDCLCQDGFQEDSEGNCIGCPICSETLPDGFEEKYCASDYVYGAKVRPDNMLRVLVELRQEESKVRETRYIDPVVDPLCTCNQLTYGDRVLIITSSEKVNIARMRQKTIETADVAGAYIVPLQKNTKEQVEEARASCQ